MFIYHTFVCYVMKTTYTVSPQAPLYPTNPMKNTFNFFKQKDLEAKINKNMDASEIPASKMLGNVFAMY